MRQLAATLARHERRRGAARLAQIIATGPAPTRASSRTSCSTSSCAAATSTPTSTSRYYVEGRRTVPDFRWPEQRLVLEADGAAWHDNPLAREDDAERQALLEAHGERVLRVTWAQAITRPGAHARQAASGGRALH